MPAAPPASIGPRRLVPARLVAIGERRMTTPSTPPAIRLKRIYAPAAPHDGARVLVDRLWPRGVSKARAALTLWCKDAAPSTELRQWFGHDPSRWDEFRRRYRAELRHRDAALAAIRDLAGHGPVTLLYAARDERHNEAVVLREVLLEGG